MTATERDEAFDLRDERNSPERPTLVARPTFTSPTLQARFERDGFVVLPLLSPSQVTEARAVFESLNGSGGTGFQTDFESDDPERKAEVFRRVVDLCGSAALGPLDDHRAFMANFLAKWPGPDSGLYVHQDWSYVDERRFRSVVVWMALDDCGDALFNGPLSVLPGSHRVAGELRGTRTSQWYASHLDVTEPAMVTVPMRAGEAVVMDNALVHSSAPNLSSTVRLAMAVGMIPMEADLLHAVADGDHSVEVLDVDDTFFRDTTPAILREGVPSRWRASPRRTSASWRTTDLALAERLCGAPLAAEPRPALGPSAPPAAGPGLVGRASAALLASHHRFVARCSEDEPFVATSQFDWVSAVEAEWPTIAAEYEAARTAGDGPFDLATIAGSPLPNVGPWRAILLRDNLGWRPAAEHHCPETAALLQRVPGVRSAMFSVLGPWARIDAHRGPNKGVLRAHLGVIVPDPPSMVTLWAGEGHVSWEEGRIFVFDDTWEHRVANRTDGWRVSLMIEFDRPLRPTHRLLNSLVQRAFRWHPQVRGARRRARDLTRALEA